MFLNYMWRYNGGILVVICLSEFIKGYTKIIICSYLFRKRDYIYNIVKKIL